MTLFSRFFLELANKMNYATRFSIQLRASFSFSYVGCTNFKVGCGYTKPVDTCPECFKGILQRDKSLSYVCSSCAYIARCCKQCGGLMSLKNGPHGKSFGCRNYATLGCKYTEKAI